jgi:hypothetical protein
MSTVPYSFANDTGNIPLSYLDVNFANVKAFANTAGYVTANAQPNITAVGRLTSLSVVGNVSADGNLVVIGNITSLANMSMVSANVATLLQANTVSATGNVTGNYFIGNGSQLTGTYGNSNVTVLLTNYGSNSISTTGNITGGNLSATTLLVAGNVRLSVGTLRLPSFTSTQLISIVGQPGDMVYNTTINRTQVWQHNAVGSFEWVDIGVAYYQ